MKTSLILVLMLSTWQLCARDYGLHFDDNGQIIKPDQALLAQGLDDEKDGFRNSALKNFKQSAEYGNHLAMSLVGFYLMQDKDYVNSLAWYKLVDLSAMPNRAYIEKLIQDLELYLSPQELTKANQIKSELAETYGKHPTLLRREQWKNNLQFTGTHLKGHIPSFLQIQLNSGLVVTGQDVKRQVEDFIYNYEFNLGLGEVTLDDVEVIEANDVDPVDNKNE